jgi:Tol biopolymer transport system component
MSPEQLQGKEVDSRSDIFSFGAVLYEMLTGRRAFDGANPASVVAAILTAQPPSLSALDPLSPPTLDRVLRRCLAKDPEARWQSIRDVGGALDCVSETTVLPAAARDSGIRARIPWVTAALLAITAAGLGAYILRDTHETPRVVKFTAPTQSVPFGVHRPLLSPDGSRVAFVAGNLTGARQLWVRSLSSFDAQRIEGAETDSDPVWSPDGKHIAIYDGDKLIRFDLAGQTRQTICEFPSSTEFSGSWSSPGVIIFSRDDAIYRVLASGGEVTPVTRVDRSGGELRHVLPYFLPDGRRFLFLAVNQRSEDSVIYQGTLDSSKVERVIANPVGPVYVIGNDLIFVRNATLMAQPFDGKTARVKGEPVSLHEHVYSLAGSFDAIAAFSASADTIAYFPEGLPSTELVWFDRQGKRLSSVGGIAHYTNPALSPDQKHIAVGITDPRTNTRDVWVLDPVGGSLRLTTDPKEDFNPTWSPDGTRIGFVSDRNGVRDLFIKPVTGMGGEQVLLASSNPKHAEAWSPDGKFLLYNQNTTKIFAVSVEGEHKPFPVVEGPAYYDQSSISPDGKWIAYTSHDGGRVEVYLQSFPVGGTRWQLSTNGGGEPSWRRDGKELYFVRDKELFAVDINVTPGGVEHGAPKLLFTAPFTAEIRRNRYVPASDGQRFLIVAQAGSPGLQAHIVLNWRAMLKKD